ncbi:mannan endo-1,4-beta-mannosidase [Raphidocelis subcapitata]|uniref:mannan endo-1,4-beta-mannosidase n=1 Tax=Raphidocelis subcapitata TaxID=307507 RepID=A0A2V0NSK5_9CHLO|nr:mannan endo-1,4-beta-mannosidase [Raphidocelis subcapitata]|eukprot:GBF90309.1 mannan endo-1,4-beta-mannosidase [Raphidocelis subcapitata]
MAVRAAARPADLARRLSLLLAAALIAAAAVPRAAASDYLVGANAYWLPTYGVDPNDAAKRLGVRLVRAWAFGPDMPYAPGKYSEDALKGLDYFVAGASRRGMRALLALGNFWNAYRGPETWTEWAKAAGGGSAGWTGDVVDFYRDPTARRLYKDHLSYMLGRTNTLTGQRYASDPAVYGYDVLNEPRCPGCDAAALSDHLSWLSEMGAFVKSTVSPSVLVLAGTEGFFTPQTSGVGLAATNPGAGAGCEGEDVLQITKLGPFDALTAHLYWRHMEHMKSLGWKRPGLELYLDWLDSKLELLTNLAGDLGKPFIAEEFGLTQRFFDAEQRKVVYAVLLSHLVQSKQRGGAFRAALFFGAANPALGDASGYDIDVTRPPTGKNVGLDNPPPAPGKQAAGGGSHGGKPPANGRRRALLRAQDPPPRGLAAAAPPPGVAVRGGARALSEAYASNPLDVLDAFRRGPARDACAVSAAYGWDFAQPGARVDAAAWKARVAGVELVDIIAEAAALLANR